MVSLQNKSDFIVSFSTQGRLEVNPPSRCINTSKFNILQDYLDNFEISYFEESGIYMFLLNGQKTDRNLIGFSQSFDFDFSNLSVNENLIRHKVDILKNISSKVPLTVIAPRYEPHLIMFF